MNDSTWGAPPPGAGFQGAPDQGRAAPGAFHSGAAGAPAHEAGGGPRTRHTPSVSDPGGSDGGHGRPGPYGSQGSGSSGPAGSGGPSGSGGASGSDGASGSGGSATSRPGSASGPGPAPQGGKKRAGRDLRAAIGVGVGLGVVILAALFFYKPVFLGVIVVAVVVGLWELTSRLTERKEIHAPLVPLAVGGAAMVTAGYLRGPEGAWVVMALTTLAVLAWRMTESPDEYLRDVTAAVFATFYVPFLATFVALLLAADDGPWRVLTFLLLTVVSDTGAYAVGWRFGRHKLAPNISPGKTREGLGGAIAFSMAAGALCMQFLIDGGVWWQGLLLGLAVAVTATLGDLGESMMKRDLGIKDMGTLLPGHGGIMDRLDSLLPTAPVVWLILVAFTGAA
ncbi:phosphatidate cytidylyltransferase [Streptomyces sp. Amel2xB2]|uniref:phosphatidate cytidylyltransferase n=1 Tax=Streptomyces sp. Amel2xB2 TaxID=1305829 RepID=UPI000DB94820|nr:phosphatidate cytidylyltransferase [Streptomyces sp. Amel2xB2]RAJ63499.1 phosphatidate cytidylyltransferase [Streptomyces sp. Amel2xB2]